jgi:transposase
MIDVGAEVRNAKQRQRRSVAEKQRIVEETLVPGMSVAAVARAHGINANQLFGWCRLYKLGQLVERRSVSLRPGTPRLLPVSVREEEPVSLASKISANVATAMPAAGTIQVQFPQAQVRVEGTVDTALLRVVLECLRG